MVLVALVDDGGTRSGCYLGMIQQLLELKRLIAFISIVVHEERGRSRVIIAGYLIVSKRLIIGFEGAVLLA